MLHHGREFGRHVDAFVRQFGPALRLGAMSLAPTLASAGLPQAAATTAVLGQATDGYSQLICGRAIISGRVFSYKNSSFPGRNQICVFVVGPQIEVINIIINVGGVSKRCATKINERTGTQN